MTINIKEWIIEYSNAFFYVLVILKAGLTPFTHMISAVMQYTYIRVAELCDNLFSRVYFGLTIK